ncbi:hypothetical protein ACKVC4_21550 (plasmid) [Escherichia coli]
MTIAERLIQKGFEKGALEVAREIACRLSGYGLDAGTDSGRPRDFPVKN